MLSNTPPGSQWATFASRESSPLASEASDVLTASTASTQLRLATNAETTDKCAIAFDVATLDVVEQSATLANEFH